MYEKRKKESSGYISPAKYKEAFHLDDTNKSHTDIKERLCGQMIGIGRKAIMSFALEAEKWNPDGLQLAISTI
ncbi:hypothetical protein SOMG_00522 [Schizosaccharomyces osmophilus]|uniref:Uncharacterized protein n=1 Tax=Schizosaccharomyces osmophilus TaxID=2545709 RepID=A0AAE9WC04_9SCHI|nr:uncharacterized protein SOMG_00522 [Schizosaccharomyces osmophilus]WBW72834.1 hypothetical protein SOMG_00522 [Schizosaccharomyces osmophilus]